MVRQCTGPDGTPNWILPPLVIETSSTLFIPYSYNLCSLRLSAVWKQANAPKPLIRASVYSPLSHSLEETLVARYKPHMSVNAVPKLVSDLPTMYTLSL